MSELLPKANHSGDPNKMVGISFRAERGAESINFSRYLPMTNCHELPACAGVRR
jgi:hypothetical protein